MSDEIDIEFLTRKRMHEDSMFYQRNNYFLLAESMLFVAFTTLISEPNLKVIMPKVIASLGVLLTFAWIYINLRHLSVIDSIRNVSKLHDSTYRKIRDRRKKWPSSRKIIAYFVPACIFFAWFVSLIFI